MFSYCFLPLSVPPTNRPAARQTYTSTTVRPPTSAAHGGYAQEPGQPSQFEVTRPNAMPLQDGAG